MVGSGFGHRLLLPSEGAAFPPTPGTAAGDGRVRIWIANAAEHQPGIWSIIIQYTFHGLDAAQYTFLVHRPGRSWQLLGSSLDWIS